MPYTRQIRTQKGSSRTHWHSGSIPDDGRFGICRMDDIKSVLILMIFIHYASSSYNFHEV